MHVHFTSNYKSQQRELSKISSGQKNLLEEFAFHSRSLLPSSSLSFFLSTPTNQLLHRLIPRKAMISSPISRSFFFFSLLRSRIPILPRSNILLLRSFSNSNSEPKTHLTNPTASFDWSDDESDASSAPKPKPKPDNLPPPYDPFSKKPVITDPSDPSDLQKIFHDMRETGLFDSAVRMFDALSKDGLAHEAMELFRVIKDKSTMPDVVAHTAVIEAYANAGGRWKDAIRTYERMLASGVLPNAYTYAVLIKGLGKEGRVGEARKYVLEMMGKGMRPNVETYVAVLEGFVREGKVEEGRELVEEMKEKGMVFDEKRVREVVGKRRHVFRSIMGMLFDK